MENREIRKLSTLRLWDKNPRSIGKKEYEALKNKIKRWGQFKPVIITKDGEVIGGNMRLRAYQDLGIEDVWVSVVDPKTEAEKLEISIADNESSGRWDEQALAELLEPYKTEIKLDDYELDLGKPTNLNDLLDQFGPEPEEDEFDGELPEEAVSKLGEVYQLGRHRLMCGDSTKIKDVEILMDGQKADMVFTDPPYGMNLDTDYDSMSKNSTKVKGNVYSNVIGDDTDFDPMPIMKMFDYCKEQLWWGADYYYDKLPPHGSWIVWVKRNENMLDIIGNHFEVCWSASPHQRRVMFKNWSGVTARNPQFEREHPTEKPISLNADVIKERTIENQIVVDLFGGSGSTLIACEQTNRTCYMSEIDNKYIDVIIKRWMKFTGKMAYKIIDEKGNPCHEPVQFADMSFMEQKTSTEDLEAVEESSKNTAQKSVGQSEEQ